MRTWGGGGCVGGWQRPYDIIFACVAAEKSMLCQLSIPNSLNSSKPTLCLEQICLNIQIVKKQYRGKFNYPTKNYA